MGKYDSKSFKINYKSDNQVILFTTKENDQACKIYPTHDCSHFIVDSEGNESESVKNEDLIQFLNSSRKNKPNTAGDKLDHFEGEFDCYMSRSKFKLYCDDTLFEYKWKSTSTSSMKNEDLKNITKPIDKPNKSDDQIEIKEISHLDSIADESTLDQTRMDIDLNKSGEVPSTSSIEGTQSEAILNDENQKILTEIFSDQQLQDQGNSENNSTAKCDNHVRKDLGSLNIMDKKSQVSKDKELPQKFKGMNVNNLTDNFSNFDKYKGGKNKSEKNLLINKVAIKSKNKGKSKNQNSTAKDYSGLRNKNELSGYTSHKKKSNRKILSSPLFRKAYITLSRTSRLNLQPHNIHYNSEDFVAYVLKPSFTESNDYNEFENLAYFRNYQGEEFYFDIEESNVLLGREELVDMETNTSLLGRKRS